MNNHPLTTDDFEFSVEATFPITRRGTGVTGEWRSGCFRSGDSAFVHPPLGEVVAVEKATVEYLLTGDTERVALLLYCIEPRQVPTGSLIRARSEP